MEKGPSTFAQYWTSEYRLIDHFERHGPLMGYSKDIEGFIKYARDAIKFARSNERGIKSFKDFNGSIYKYSPKTNEFIIITKDGKIVTYFKPDNPHTFIYNKFDECGDYWIN